MRAPSRRTRIALAWLAVSAAARGLGAQPAATAITVEGRRIEGRLVDVEPAPAVVLQTEEGRRRMACGDLLALRLGDAQPSPRADHIRVALRQGGQLRGRLRGGGEHAVELESAALGSVACPLGAIASIAFAQEPAGEPPEPAQKADRLVLLNGETIEGTVKSIDATGVAFRAEHLGEVELGFDRVVAATFASQGGREAPRPEGVVAIVRADDGTAVAGRLRGLEEGRLKVDALFGPALAFDIAAVLELEFRGGRLVYLSDLEPAKVEETPFFDLVWHYHRDRSVDGHPLRIGERTYSKGLGVHTRCELTYALEGDYQRFLADVGIDEEMGERGNACVRVLVDGEVRFERESLRGSDGPVAVAVDLEGARELTLVADFGAELDIGDHVDWANARLIR
ncbi:MAG: NPCBM/NEW2 domain-containing protein [Candidatus Brocadiia bacterium]